MPMRIKAQQDYLLTEVNMELPCDLNELDLLMKRSRSTGKIVAMYNEGGVMGINVEQKTKIRARDADKVREIVDVVDKELNGYHR